MSEREDEQWQAQRQYWRALDEVAQRRAPEFVGKSVDSAEELADGYQLTLRLIDLSQGGTVAWTQEYELGRITAFVSDGIITGCSAG